jgi:hypothetical protein
LPSHSSDEHFGLIPKLLVLMDIVFCLINAIDLMFAMVPVLLIHFLFIGILNPIFFSMVVFPDELVTFS